MMSSLPRRSRLLCLVASLLSPIALSPIAGPARAESDRASAPGSDTVEWRHYGADRASSKYSPADRIDRDNVSALEIAWRWTTPDDRAPSQVGAGAMKGTPIFVDGTLYAVSAYSMVSALDPATGEEHWTWDPRFYELGRPTHNGFTQRGLEWWQEGELRRIFVTAGSQHLLALDPATGRPAEGFGKDGVVDLGADIGPPEVVRHTGLNSPAIVCADQVVVGMVVNDYPSRQQMPPGHVRAYDARTGEHRWTFHTVPQNDEPGVESWENESWRYSGNTNVWSLMSCDEELGLVYLPIGTPTNDHYGGHRLGDNLYAESLVALDARTGERRWHFQAVHHGLWDYDFPCAPNLVDLEVDGRRVPAVAQVSKQGFTYVFDRRSGEPIWPIEERPVPQTDVPGERTAPTQPHPTRPPPFEPQGVVDEHLIDLTPELKQKAREILADFVTGPLFMPPIVEGAGGKISTVVAPGLTGGANWGGAAVDPESAVLYVPSHTRVHTVAVKEPSGRMQSDFRYVRSHPDLEGPEGLPIFKPPWSRITAIDLNRGEILWVTPHGDGPRDHPALAGLDLPRLGSHPTSGLPPGFVLVTRNLVFAAQSLPAPGAGRRGPSIGYLRAYSKIDGELLWEAELDKGVTGAPMTYVHDGRQYVVVPVGDGTVGRELVAFALPAAG